MMTDEEMLGLLVRLDERTKTMADDVEQLKHVILEGNGTPALTVQVARLDERLDQVDREREAKLPRWSIYVAVAGVAATLIIEIAKLV